MKYMVMECHPAYAVLMDEASCITYAANLHYEVGQIVESPVLLADTVQKNSRIRATVRHFAAAAACLLVLAGGAAYYGVNYTKYTSIMVSAAASVSMDVSRSGKVLSVRANNPDAETLLADYDCRGKDQLTVTNELIDRAVRHGYVRKGDTVHVYYEKDKPRHAEAYRNQIEQEIAAREMTADVRGDFGQGQVPTAPAVQTTSPEPSAPPETLPERRRETPRTEPAVPAVVPETLPTAKVTEPTAPPATDVPEPTHTEPETVPHVREQERSADVREPIRPETPAPVTPAERDRKQDRPAAVPEPEKTEVPAETLPVETVPAPAAEQPEQPAPEAAPPAAEEPKKPESAQERPVPEEWRNKERQNERHELPNEQQEQREQQMPHPDAERSQQHGAGRLPTPKM